VARRQPARATDQPELAFSPKRAGSPPEEVARKAAAKRPTTPSGRVAYTLTITLLRDVAERLTARSIRESKSLEALVTEIIEAELRRSR
jgi:hypothetical protein